MTDKDVKIRSLEQQLAGAMAIIAEQDKVIAGLSIDSVKVNLLETLIRITNDTTISYPSGLQDQQSTNKAFH